LGAALAWAAYILVSRRMGTSEHALGGLALATVLGAVLTLPGGVLVAGAELLEPRTLLLGLAVGVLSSAIPYSLDLLALRRLRTAVFGVLTSLNPAIAALAGLLVLHELPPHRQLVGIALVMVASAGVTLTGHRRGSARKRSGQRPGATGGGVPPSRTGEPHRVIPAAPEHPDSLRELPERHPPGEGQVRRPSSGGGQGVRGRLDEVRDHRVQVDERPGHRDQPHQRDRVDPEDGQTS
jgi:hypothetical protein